MDASDDIEEHPAFARAIDHVNTQLDETQRLAFMLLRSMPAGITIVHGPPGTGKTHFGVQAFQPLLTIPVGEKKNQVLVLSAANPTVDDVHYKLEAATRHAFTAMGKNGDPIVIRLHAVSTERQILTKDVERPSKRPPITLDAAAVDELKDPSVAKRFMQQRSEATRRVHKNVFDKRVKLITKSMGYWMGVVSGLVERADGAHAAPVRHAHFRDMYSQWDHGAEFTSDQNTDFTKAINALRMHVLEMADVVVATLSAAADAKLYNTSFQPVAILLEEAGRACEADCWAMFAFYPSVRFWMLIGDPMQLRPHVSCDKGFCP